MGCHWILDAVGVGSQASSGLGTPGIIIGAVLYFLGHTLVPCAELGRAVGYSQL